MTKILAILAAIILGLGALIVTVGHREIASGDKVGVFTKMGKQGVFHKTWEGELIRGGMQGGTGVNGAAFHFTVKQDELVGRVEKAMESGAEVKISYRREWFTFGQSESDDFFLTGITVIEPKAVAPTYEKADATSSIGAGVRAGLDQGKVANLLKIQGELLKVQAELLQELAH
jgi:hypothetical protein